MKKGFVLLLALFLVSGVFSFPKVVPAQKITLQFWSSWASEYTRPTVDKIVAKWNSLNPNIQVIHTPVSAQMVDKFKIAVASRNAPDIITGELTNLYDPAGKPRAEVEKECPFIYIDKYIDTKYKRDFYDDGWFRQEALYEGYIGIPVEMNAEVMFYNKDLFKLAGLNPEVPPKTIEQFHRYIERITQVAIKKGIEKYGYIFEAKNPSEIAFLENFAGPLAGHLMPIGYRNKAGEYVLTIADSKNLEGLEKLYRIPYEKKWTPKVLGYDYMTARAAFGQGLAGFYRIGAYMMLVYNRQYPNLNYGICDLPKITQDGIYIAGGTSSFLLVTRKEVGGHPEEAIKFAMFFANEENQRLRALESGKVVPNRRAYVSNMPKYLLNVRKILDTRMKEQENWKKKQIEAYPDVEVVEKGGVKMVIDSVPAQIGGGEIINIAGSLMQQYLEGRIQGKDMLIQLEKEWANILKREGLKINEASIGWDTPRPVK